MPDALATGSRKPGGYGMLRYLCCDDGMSAPEAFIASAEGQAARLGSSFRKGFFIELVGPVFGGAMPNKNNNLRREFVRCFTVNEHK